MRNNIKALLLDLGAILVKDTSEIRQYFTEKTGIKKRALTHWWLNPDAGISQENIPPILDFFNKEYKALKIKKTVTVEDLQRNKEAEKQIATKFSLTTNG